MKSKKKKEKNGGERELEIEGENTDEREGEKGWEGWREGEEGLDVKSSADRSEQRDSSRGEDRKREKCFLALRLYLIMPLAAMWALLSEQRYVFRICVETFTLPPVRASPPEVIHETMYGTPPQFSSCENKTHGDAGTSHYKSLCGQMNHNCIHEN